MSNKELETKLKDLKELEEHTRNNLIQIQDDIRELEESKCKHQSLTYHNGVVWQCDDCNELFYIEKCPF